MFFARGNAVHRSGGAPVIFVIMTAAITAFGTAGCGCKAYLNMTLLVDVIDSVTREPAAAGSTVIVTGGSLYDSITVPDSPSTRRHAYFATENRVGVGKYAVRVRKPGYRLWSTNIRVTEVDGCHAKGGSLTAALQRE